MTESKYANQRVRIVPPHVSLQSLRVATGMTLDELCERVGEVTGKEPPKRGTMSAIENGIRGASSELLDAIALAYGLQPGSVTTTYRPRRTTRPGVAA